jgi:hypothetical protein
MASDDPRLHWDTKYKAGLPTLEEADPFVLTAYRQFLPEQPFQGCRTIQLSGPESADVFDGKGLYSDDFRTPWGKLGCFGMRIVRALPEALLLI